MGPHGAADGKAGGAGQPGPRRTRLGPWLAALGLASLCFLLGAAVMFFEWPPSDVLGKGFLAARAWNERRQVAAPTSDDPLPVPAPAEADRPGQTFDGFTLYTCATTSAPATQAFLINMRRELVHKWAVPFSQVWRNPPHLRGEISDSLVCFFGCHLYPNGDLLVVFHGLEQVGTGYGLARLDKDSNVLWKYPARVHHDVDVAEDGTIYAVKQEDLSAPPEGLEYLPSPCLADYLVALSPDGKELRKPVPLLEAFRDSPYAALLGTSAKPGRQRPPGMTAPRVVGTLRSQDVLHTNSVKVLTRELAPKFPDFKAGQLLISMRELHAVAVLDPDTGAVVWATRGPWQAQHDAQFLDNGRLLVFDNLGSPQTSRVLEYEPRTQTFPWSYPGRKGAPFFTSERGMCQRLPNGNTLVVNSEGGQILEVTPGDEVVWRCAVDGFLTTGRRYAADQLPFLRGDQRARP